MSSIWSGLSGIRAHQMMLDVIGNNLANMETIGYKSSSINFADTMSEMVQEARAATTDLGGTNPSQIGMGVELGTIRRDFSQGNLRTTGNALDLAIDGRGFLVLSQGGSNAYSRSSSFTVDSNSKIVEAVSGYRLISTENEAITIPHNERIPAQKTENITFVGNLSAGASAPGAEVLSTTNALLAGGSAATSATTLDALDSTTTSYVSGDVIRITGKDSSGVTLTPADFTYGTDGTTVGDLVTAINTFYGANATASLDADGNIAVTAATKGDANLSLDLDTYSGTGVTTWSSHSFYTATDGLDGGTRQASAMINDSRGEGHVLTVTFQKTGNMTWDMSAVMSDGEGTLTKDTVTGITFNADGSLDKTTESGDDAGKIIVDYGDKATRQEIVFDFGKTGGFNGLTQFGGDSNAAAASQDGYAAGTLASFGISRDGVVEGLYSNGKRREIAKVMIATFDNPEGLQGIGKNLWEPSLNSGEPLYGSARSGRAGAVASSSLEDSNVEAASELTSLIIAQYGYQLSARTISVSNRIIQELTSLLR